MLRWIVALGAAAAFGAFDDRLTGSGFPWFWVSQMSALWLLLAFLAGAVARSAVEAAVLGLVVTMLALVTFHLPDSYGVHQAFHTARPYVLGGSLTGPVFGVLGHHWRRARSVLGAVVPALVLAAAFCLEPLAWRRRLGFVPSPTWIWDLEVVAGLVLAACLSVAVRRRRTPLG